MTSSLQGFKKSNEACVLLIEDQPCPFCCLCDKQLVPTRLAYKSHMGGSIHRSKLFSIFERLVMQALSPGVFVVGNDDNVEKTTIYCVLCEQQVSCAFDFDFHNHILGPDHQMKLDHQMNLQDCHGFHSLAKNSKSKFGKTVEDDALLKKISRAGIIVLKDGRNHCVPCNRQLISWSQYCAHMEEAVHRQWVFGQLSKIVDKVGLSSLGVMYKKSSLLHCALCDCRLGNGSMLATDAAYKHVNGTAADDPHKKKVQEQIEKGLYEYYEKKEMETMSLIASVLSPFTLLSTLLMKDYWDNLDDNSDEDTPYEDEKFCSDEDVTEDDL